MNKVSTYLKQSELIDTIKILLYKENPILLEKLHFKDDATFLEPLLFAYFNNKSSFQPKALYEILQGYFVEKEMLKIDCSYNKEGVAYLPKIGYLNKGKVEPFKCIEKIEGTNIEILLYATPYLKPIFKDSKENPIDSSKIEITPKLTNKYLPFLTNAFSFIRESNPTHLNLIEQVCKKIVLFKTNPENTNSFATINAHGVAFFNVYQEDYDEVFFVDDISHQTGHVIMNTFWFVRKEHFIIDENAAIKEITKEQQEYRSFYILFHALYTYYTSIVCLEKCMDNNCFTEIQKMEATARIGFYLKKYHLDINSFETVCTFYNGIENVVKEESTNLYLSIKAKFKESYLRWNEVVSLYNYKNQTYNFNFSIFKNENPKLF